MSEYTLTLREVQDVAEGTPAFIFDKPDGFTFIAGQHAALTLPDLRVEDGKGNERLFSIAAAPHEDFLMFATRQTHSTFKETLAGSPKGTSVLASAPGGDLVLHKDAAKPAVFLIGGIGITPVRSIVMDALHRSLPHQLTLFYSNKTPSGSAFLPSLQDANNAHSTFTLVATMTDVVSGDWDGEHGFIDEEMLKRHLPELSTPVFYIVGPPGFAKAMRELLDALGVDDLHIRTESFSGY